MSSFGVEEFRRIFRLRPGRAHQVLHSLEKRGVVRRLARGRYVLAGLGGVEALGQPFLVGTRLLEPSYVSFWSAIHYYGWTDQAPRLVFVANTKRSGGTRIHPYTFRFVKLRPQRFFGYGLGRQGNVEFPIAEPEKAIVDGGFLPEYAGGIGEVGAALEEALDSIRLDRLEAFAVGMKSRSLCSRLGFLLERLGQPVEILRSKASAVYVKLDPRGPRRGRWDARWRIIDNLPGVP